MKQGMVDEKEKYNWHKIADSIEDLHFADNSLAEIEVAGKTVCIVLQKEQMMACSQKCPHAGGNLSNGFLDAAGNIVCPLHRYRFKLQNGQNVSGEGYFLKTYPVENRNDGVFIGIKENNFLNWLK